MSNQTLRSTLEGGGCAFGTWALTDSEPVVEILDRAGYDFLGLDCQHGILSEADAVAQLLRMSNAQTDLLVRVSANSPALIGRVLDAGADGVIVPLVNTAVEAREAVAACLFPPAGVRSFGPIRGDLPRSLAELNARVTCFVMIETEEGIKNAAEICAVPGVTGVLVGPSDLSIGLGMDPAQGLTSDQLFEPLDTIRQACESGGVTLGLFAADQADLQKWVDQGVRLLVASTDVGLLSGAAAAALDAARSAPPIAG